MDDAVTLCAPIAALYVERNGVYFGLSCIDPWDKQRDARLYAGPYPVIAHPPCERWGRFWHGSTRKPHQYDLGDDGGCFAAALAAVRRWGGVLEHPEGSQAWATFAHNPPPRSGGWVVADFEGGWTCCVEQGRYGHFSNKPTWLYACKIELPSLRWGKGPQRLHPIALARHGYEKARRIGMVAMVGGKHKKRIRDATPIEFRDLLISMVLPAATRMAAMSDQETRRYGFQPILRRHMAHRVALAPQRRSRIPSGHAVHPTGPQDD